MKTISINNEATIKATGNLSSRRCKPVICIDTGETFTSATDAAEKMGVHPTMISAACIGKVQTCKKMHFCYLNSALENLDAVVTRLRETSAMEEDAKKWRAYQAELEAVRKAKEQHEEAVAKAKAKLERCNKICERLESDMLRAAQRRMEAEEELRVLTESETENVA